MVDGQNQNRAARWAALILLVGALLLAFAYWDFWVKSPAVLDATEVLTIDTKSGLKTFHIEVARNPEQQALGLMFRTSLADDHGMLFPHDDARELTMWMSNTYIPLDMVFIRADGIIHRIEANTQPMSERHILSNGPVAGVLEIAGGAAARLGIAAGDQVHHAQFKSAAN